MISARQARDTGVVGGGLARLADDHVDLAAGLLDDVLDAARVDAPVGDELGESQARDLAAHRVEAADHDRVRSVIDDEVDAGRLLEGADVAALSADDAALHLIRGDGHDRHRGFGGVIHHDALDRRDDDVAGLVLGALASRTLDGAHEAHGVVLSLLPDLLDEDCLGVVRGQAADALERAHLVCLGGGELRALRSELLLPDEQLAIPLLEHVRALVELFIARQQTPLQVGQIVAPGAAFLVQLPMQANLLLLRLEDELLLLGTRLGHDAFRLLGRGPDGL